MYWKFVYVCLLVGKVHIKQLSYTNIGFLLLWPKLVISQLYCDIFHKNSLFAAVYLNFRVVVK